MKKKRSIWYLDMHDKQRVCLESLGHGSLPGQAASVEQQRACMVVLIKEPN